jgi:hypothetical protein
MKKGRSVEQKAMGRPRTGITPLIGFRADTATRVAITRWAENQPDKPTLSEAIRRLVELGLTVETKAKQPADIGASRAKELATKAVEKIIDSSVPSEERAQRRRQLTKGPSEFREDRVDQPKAKGK